MFSRRRNEAASTATRTDRSAQHPLKVGLYGGFGTGNTGNDATAAVAVEHLRATHPDLDLRLITYGTETAAVAERLGVRTVSTQPVPRGAGRGPHLAGLLPGAVRSAGARAWHLTREAASIWATLRSVDAVVVLGCGIFEAESTVGGRGWRAMADLYLVSLVSSLGSHRLAFVGIGGTAMPTRLERTLVVAAMRRADRRSFRDEESKAALERMGGGHRDDLVVADLVFAADFAADLATDGAAADHGAAAAGAAEHARTDGAQLGTARPTVALGVMAFDWLRRRDGALSPQDPYLGAFVETAVGLVRQGQDVVVFAGDVADRFAVDLVTQEARARLGSAGDRVTMVLATSLAEQVPVLAGARTVIGSRFHNAVTALMVGRAPIAVLDRTKVRTLMHTMGLDDHVLEARSLASPALLELVARAQAEREATEARTATAVQAARARALRGLVELDQLVDRWDGHGALADQVSPAVSSGAPVA